MGYPFEVWAWSRETEMDDYSWFCHYNGERYDEAMAMMKRLKEEGCSCVKFLWR